MSRAIVSEAVKAEIKVVVDLELAERKIDFGDPQDVRRAVRAVNEALMPLFEKRWSPLPSIPAIDKAWRDRAVARLAQADIAFFGLQSRYSEDQPRDAHGRFATGAGLALDKAEIAHSAQEHKQAAKAHKDAAKYHEDAANKAAQKGVREGVKNHLAAAYAHEAAAEAHSNAAGAPAGTNIHKKAQSLSISANNASAKVRH